MKIYFAVQCHNFQRRFAWQLSSMFEQYPFDAELIIDVACMPRNGDPTTEYLCWYYQYKGMNINYNYYRREIFAKRGLVRNWQIKDAKIKKADWIFFADCDNVYDPHFFQLLVEELKTTTATNCIYSKAKMHTETERTDQHARLVKQAPYIPYAYLRASRIPTTGKGNKSVAAGCMQVCRLSDIYEKTGGVYVTEEECGDRHLFNKGQKAKSDKQFRKKMGGSTQIFLPEQVHLGHKRDKEEGYHLESQR